MSKVSRVKHTVCFCHHKESFMAKSKGLNILSWLLDAIYNTRLNIL